ncbi:MAG TPA: maltotransferase domain-containing protein, partial [Jiangellaceae bacterium]|nr:maltotransferase domain-containing protein [Jiangellaceae bacterium]
MTGRIPILDAEPVIGCGRYLAKAVVGERFEVAATVLREGHDAVAASVSFRDPAGRVRQWVRMRKREPWSDRWFAELSADDEGEWSFTIEGWSDPIGTWRHAAEVKIPAQIDVQLVFTEGAQLLERAAGALPRGLTAERRLLRDTAKAVRDERRPPPVRLAAAMAPDVTAILDAHPLRDLVTEDGPYSVQVDRERALYGSWYEFFPRSEGAIRSDDGSWTSGTFETAAKRLPAIADMGFDVVYLPPIHPIGSTYRKGANNTLTPDEHDPGVPWAIGSEAGGHDAIHPELGTFDRFDDFVSATRELGMEVALDLALQASPDHPWVTEHPEWFSHRADGTITYAENPPKKYQDIYPLDFGCEDWRGLWNELLGVTLFWVERGVRIFRVDNPHTKTFGFWEWCIDQVHARDPRVIFLSEAFTRPKPMRYLAKLGFTQSYTHFTWRNTKAEL